MNKLRVEHILDVVMLDQKQRTILNNYVACEPSEDAWQEQILLDMDTVAKALLANKEQLSVEQANAFIALASRIIEFEDLPAPDDHCADLSNYHTV